MTLDPHSHDAASLSLQEASRMIGISPSTLRRWADAGKVPSQRTLGGHRRFSRDIIRALAPYETARQALPPATIVIDNRELARQEWHAKLGEHPAADRMRGLGQRLLGLLIQHVDSHEHDSRAIGEARAVGLRYGAEAFRAAVSLHDAVQAFLFFSRACSQWVIPESHIPQPADLAEAVELHERIDYFMSAVLLGVVAGYEGERAAR
jgi:excisionase family DNA binding protein